MVEHNTFGKRPTPPKKWKPRLKMLGAAGAGFLALAGVSRCHEVENGAVRVRAEQVNDPQSPIRGMPAAEANKLENATFMVVSEHWQGTAVKVRDTHGQVRLITNAHVATGPMEDNYSIYTKDDIYLGRARPCGNVRPARRQQEALHGSESWYSQANDFGELCLQTATFTPLTWRAYTEIQPLPLANRAPGGRIPVVTYGYPGGIARASTGTVRRSGLIFTSLKGDDGLAITHGASGSPIMALGGSAKYEVIGLMDAAVDCKEHSTYCKNVQGTDVDTQQPAEVTVSEECYGAPIENLRKVTPFTHDELVDGYTRYVDRTLKEWEQARGVDGGRLLLGQLSYSLRQEIRALQVEYADAPDTLAAKRNADVAGMPSINAREQILDTAIEQFNHAHDTHIETPELAHYGDTLSV